MQNLTEQLNRMRTLIKSDTITEGFGEKMSLLARELLGIRSPEEKMAIAQRYIDSGKNPNVTAAYNQFLQQDPDKAAKYVRFYSNYPEGYPKWNGQDFVEQVHTSMMAEDDSSSQIWDTQSVGNVLQLIGQKTTNMGLSGDDLRGITNGSLGTVNFYVDDSEQMRLNLVGRFNGIANKIVEMLGTHPEYTAQKASPERVVVTRPAHESIQELTPQRGFTNHSLQEYDNEGKKQDRLDVASKKKVNRTIQEITKQNYFDQIPLDLIFDGLKKHGLVVLQEDQTLWDGFLLGRDEHVIFEIAYQSSEYEGNNGIPTYVPITNAGLSLSWYKMESGRYEIVAYVN